MTLEPLSADHLPGLCEAGRSPDIWVWNTVVLSDKHAMVSYVGSALAQAEDGTALPFAAIDMASRRVAGSTRFANLSLEHRRVEIGWTWLAAEFQRTCLNTEMKYLMLRHAFDLLGCARVEFKTDVLNVRSRTALLRIGAREEGVLRKHMLVHGGRWRDTVYYRILDTEWPAVRERLEGFLP